MSSLSSRVLAARTATFSLVPALLPSVPPSPPCHFCSSGSTACPSSPAGSPACLQAAAAAFADQAGERLTALCLCLRSRGNKDEQRAWRGAPDAWENPSPKRN